MPDVIYNGHSIPIADTVAERFRLVDGQSITREQIRGVTLANAQAHLGLMEFENVIGKKPHQDTSRLQEAIDLCRENWR